MPENRRLVPETGRLVPEYRRPVPATSGVGENRRPVPRIEGRSREAQTGAGEPQAGAGEPQTGTGIVDEIGAGDPVEQGGRQRGQRDVADGDPARTSTELVLAEVVGVLRPS